MTKRLQVEELKRQRAHLEKKLFEAEVDHNRDLTTTVTLPTDDEMVIDLVENAHASSDKHSHLVNAPPSTIISSSPGTMKGKHKQINEDPGSSLLQVQYVKNRYCPY